MNNYQIIKTYKKDQDKSYQKDISTDQTFLVFLSFLQFFTQMVILANNK